MFFFRYSNLEEDRDRIGFGLLGRRGALARGPATEEFPTNLGDVDRTRDATEKPFDIKFVTCRLVRL